LDASIPVPRQRQSIASLTFFPVGEKDMVPINALREYPGRDLADAVEENQAESRIAAHEIMTGELPAARNSIREGEIAQMSSSIQTGQACRGMQTLDQRLQDLVRRKGLVTKDEARMKAQEQRRYLTATDGEVRCGT
jgi:Tfp pilus assembly pilus retraction ATPase PilT